jgi:hypothetical protein
MRAAQVRAPKPPDAAVRKKILVDDPARRHAF